VSDVAAVKDVLRAEQDLYRAMVAHDRAALHRMLAPDVVYVHSTAVAESRDEYLAGVAAGRYEYESVRSRDTRVRIHGETAFIDGICDMRVGARGRPATLIHLLFVLAWQRSGGAWRLVHRHAVRMPDA
jgi:ketosteroid isomerase-like protein